MHSHTSTGRLSKIFALHCILAYTCTHTNWRWWCCCSVEKTREHNTCNIHPVGSAIGCRLRAHFMEIISWYINRRMLTPSVLSLGLYASDWDSCVACCAEKHTHYRIQDEPMIHTVSNWHGKEEKWLWFGTPNEEEHIVNYFNSFDTYGSKWDIPYIDFKWSDITFRRIQRYGYATHFIFVQYQIQLIDTRLVCFGFYWYCCSFDIFEKFVCF